jgi:long-chain acyl-CoA synthetase
MANAPIGRSDQAYDDRLPRYPTVVHAFADVSRQAPDRTALQSLGDSLNYRDYMRAVSTLSDRIVGMGARHGRIATAMTSGIENTVALMSGMAAGAQVAPLNPMYTEHELVPMLADVDAAVVLTDRTYADKIRDIAAKAGVKQVLVMGDGDEAVDRLVSDGADGLAHPLPEPADPSCMFFTGGTTGVPKAADHVHSEMMAYLYATLTMWKLEFDAERMLNVAPQFHVWGFAKSVVTPMYLGGSIDILPAFKPDIVLSEFESKGITVFFGGPAAMYVGLRAHPNYQGTDLGELRYCFAGGSACPVELVEGWEAETGAPMIEGWGMSEGAPINLNQTHGLRKPGSCGPTCPETMIDIVDVETGTEVLGVGQRGEIRLQGPQFCKKYRNRPDENAIAFRDGWFYTGDIGYFDEDGYMWLVDRKKEMILVGGYNVYPREIDELVSAHPAVMEAAAVGVPDDFRGETVKLCVALNPGASLSAEDLAAYCEQHLVKYKQPTQIEFFPELPKTGPGKIDKLGLKGMR